MRTSACLLVALLGSCVVTSERVYDPEVVEASSAAQFELLKGLVGTWTGMASGHGETFPVEIRYRMTAAGSTLEETLFPGGEHEMVSMYHRDGPWLMMTHYCAGGNQPRMRALHTSPPPGAQACARIQFEYLDATDMASSDEPVMHDVLFDLTDRDHMVATWSSWKADQPSERVEFRVQRAR